MLSQMSAGRAAPPPQGRQGGDARVAAVPFGGVDPVYAIGSDGMLHTLAASNAADQEPPVAFLPPSARPSALIWVDGMVYTSTSNDCGAAPNAVWALDLTTSDKKPTVWKTGGANVAGTTGPALGTTGDLYVALSAKPPRTTASGPAAETPDGDAVVVLDGHTLRVKDWFSAAGADFNTSPIVIREKDRELIAAAGNDGRLYLLDGKSVGGGDHKTPLFVTPKYTAAGAGGALATWESDGTRWILAPAVGAAQGSARSTANGLTPNGAIVAFKLVDQGGKPALEAAWSSRDLTSPLGPIVVNGLVIAASSGEYRAATGRMTAAQRAATIDSCGAVRARWAHRQGIVEQRQDDHVLRSRRALGRQRPGLSRDVRQSAVRLRDSDGALRREGAECRRQNGRRQKVGRNSESSACRGRLVRCDPVAPPPALRRASCPKVRARRKR